MNAARSTLIAVAGNGGAQLVRLASNLVLTRLLFPEAFGLMALVMTFVQGLQMISDVGIVPSIVQHRRGEERAFLDTAWTVSALRGFLLALVAVLLAWPFALLYEQPELLPMLLVLALSAAFTGLESTKVAVAVRRMHNGRVVLLDLATQLFQLAVNIALAYAWRSVWALVVGFCVCAAVRTLASHLFLPGPLDRPRMERATLDALVSFGKWVLLSTLITFLAARLDVIILGKLLTIDALGIFSLATVLAALPSAVAGVVLGATIVPVLARAARQSGDALQASFTRTMGYLMPAMGFITMGVVLGAPAFFALLYDDRYHDAGWITQLVMVQVWLTILHDVGSRVFVAIGNARPLVTANACKLVVACVCAIAGHAWFGLPGFLLGNAVGAAAGFLAIAVALQADHVKLAGIGARWTLFVATFGLAAVFATAPFAEATGLSPVLASIVVGVATLVVYVAVVTPRALRLYRTRAVDVTAEAPAASTAPTASTATTPTSTATR